MERIAFRILALTILVVSMIADVKDFQFVMKPELQLILGTVVVAITIFADAIVGFALGLAVFVLYLRVHADHLGIDLSSSWRDIVMPKANSRSDKILDKYITPENLNDAQTNVVSDDTEIKGITDPYGKGVYGAQGLDSKLPGISAAPVNNWENDASI